MAAVAEDREIVLGSGLPAIPERLLLAHARGEVLFICGAGISMPAGLPDFRQLVLDIYETLDAAVHSVIAKLPRGACNKWAAEYGTLNNSQAAEVARFIQGDYDVVLGMLERRLDGETMENSRVRAEVRRILFAKSTKPAPIHQAIVSLADRGGSISVVTTNFDLLLERATSAQKPKIQSYSLGGIPRPTRKPEFAGIFHIHGSLATDANRLSELVLSDQDFGEFYLRRRVVPDFIYDAARLYNLVLVGYSANDPPMRYLLNAVAADGTRFSDLKERFTFFGTEQVDEVAIEDWKARGITPIHYSSKGGHSVLADVLDRWAKLSAVNGAQKSVDAVISGIVKSPYPAAKQEEQDLFEHLFRRGSTKERERLAKLVSTAGADIGWLKAIIKVGREFGKDLPA